ncbi:MAG: T9SS type A sorting domain-containing protein [Crocinitomicaceae bacterium]
MKKLLLVSILLFPIFLPAQMTTENNATQYGDCDCYQLTPPGIANTKGAIWSPDPLDLTNGFDMTFDLYFGIEDVYGADGMTFVLQQNGTGIGDFGHSLGYEPPSPDPNPISGQSIAVEFDIWDSGTAVPTDIADDHIALNSNGSVDHNIVAPLTFPSSQNIEDGAYHECRFVYDHSITTFLVYWEGSATPILTYYNPNFITDHFSGNSTVYWGFTASTGGAYNEMRVCSGGNASFTTDLTTVCPGSSIQFTDGSTSETGITTSWLWDFGDGGPTDNTQNPTYTYNTPGSYWAYLTVTDGFGCDRQDSVEITVLPDLILDMDSTAVSCFGDSDGTAVATPLNGNGSYTYTWDDPSTQSTQTATNLPPGVYSVLVTDGLGCEGEDSVMIDEPAEILLTMSSVDIACYQDSTGQASVSVTNGVAPLSYLWDDQDAQTTDVATNLSAGTYTVLVTDDSGCSQSDMVTLSEAPELIVSGTTTADDGTANGAIDLTVSGGTPAYSYSWSNGETTEDISNLPAGTYTVTVTDANECTVQMTFEVTSSVGLFDFSAEAFTVYPNPTSGLFTVKATGQFELTILDIRGRKIYHSIENENVEIDLSAFEKGLYVLSVNKNGKAYQQKLILH